MFVVQRLTYFSIKVHSQSFGAVQVDPGKVLGLYFILSLFCEVEGNQSTSLINGMFLVCIYRNVSFHVLVAILLGMNLR